VHRPFRGLLGVHSRYGLHTRAATKSWLALPEGFRHFVSSMPAPVASGWSVCRVGLSPTGKRRLVTAHTLCSPSPHRPERQPCRASRLWRGTVALAAPPKSASSPQTQIAHKVDAWMLSRKLASLTRRCLQPERDGKDTSTGSRRYSMSAAPDSSRDVRPQAIETRFGVVSGISVSARQHLTACSDGRSTGRELRCRGVYFRSTRGAEKRNSANPGIPKRRHPCG